MKFAKNRLYIESYTKCPNCGILIFEELQQNMEQTILIDGKRYCSSWCVSWEGPRGAQPNESAARAKNDVRTDAGEPAQPEQTR